MEKTGIYRTCCIVLIVMPSTAMPVHAQNADIDILKQINLNRNHSLDNTMAALTNSVYPITAAVPLSELIAGYKRHDKQLIAAGWTTTAGVAANFIVTFGLKYSVNRTRPYISYPQIQHNRDNKDASFPSGHTSFAFNTATSLTMFYPKWYVVIPAYTWATAVGYSRMHLGMHYPSDVVVGALVGAGTSWLSVKGNKWLEHRKQNKHAAP